MAAIDLPTLPARQALRGVFIGRAEVAGTELFTVTAWHGASRPPRRQWFADRAIALAHAAQVADEMAAPLFDLTGDDA